MRSRSVDQSLDRPNDLHPLRLSPKKLTQSETDKNMVIILGNGFDLNLGLKTGYHDFIRSKCFTDLIDNGNALAIHLKEKNELQKWIDIENELKVYSLEVYRDDNRKVFKVEYKALCQSLCDYLNNIDYNGMIVDSVAYGTIVNICTKYKNITILNFNYTKSVDRIISNEMLETPLKIVQIHGSADSGNIIFGIEDGAGIDERDIFLLKSASPHFVCDVDFSSILKKEENLQIMGHSLGETDHFYFEEFFNSQSLSPKSRKHIHITYHGEDGWDEIMIQLNKMTNKSISKLRQCNNVYFVNTGAK